MDSTVQRLVAEVKNRNSHLIAVTGNVYDSLPYGDIVFPDALSFIVDLTERKHPQCLTYDIFSGLKVVRGDTQAVAKLMGFAPEKDDRKKDENADLVAALKKAKMVPGADFPINPLEIFPGLGLLLEKSDVPTAILIDYAETVIPAQFQGANLSPASRVLSVALTKWSRSQAVRQKGHLIVLISRRPTDIDEQVLDRVFETCQITIPKPDQRERVAFLESRGLDQDRAKLIGKVTSGLAFKDHVAIGKLAAATPKNDDLLDAVFAIKQKILREDYGELLEVLQPRFGFEAIGGLERPIRELQLLAKAMREGKTSLVPQGALLMGPPGTGKTVLVESFAKEAGLNFIRPTDIKSMWVGESERRMTRFLNAVRDLVPTIVFIDEFDQNQGQRGGFDGDSGVSRSLFKKMLEIMSDTSLRGKVLWMLATNRPDLIDPAMKRPGRCDLRIPFFPPNEGQLAKICESAFRQYPEMKAGIANWAPYAKKCAGYSGADMVEVVRRAWKHANENDRPEIADADMKWACEDYRPQVANWRQTLQMTLQGLAECSSKSLLPDNHEELIQDYVEELTGQRPKKVMSVEEIGEILRAPNPN